MVAAVTLQNQTQPKSQQFYKLTLEELKQDYKNKRINAEAYLKYLIKTKLAAGWEWRFNVKQFCIDWEIVERTFYWALSRLKTRNEISFRPANDNIILWWDKKVPKIANVDFSDSANSRNLDTVMAPQDVAEAMQDVVVALQDITDPPQDVAEQNAKTLTVVESCNPSYSLQINPEKYTDFHEEVCVVFEKLLDQEPECEQQSFVNFKNFENETNQDAIPGSPTTLLDKTEISEVVDITSNGDQAWAAPISDTEISQVANKTSDEGQGFAPTGYKNDEPNQDAINESHTTLLGEVEPLQVANKTSSEGKGFAPPVRKTSQKEKWICPGTEEEKNEFLIFKGGLLVTAKQCQPVEARTAALNWADHKPEAANLLWEDWQRQKAEDANRSTAHETMPEFRRMPEQEHAEVLEKFINVGGEGFLKLCWWYKHWLQFTTTPKGQKRIPGLTPEIIKQIKQALR